MVDLICIVWAVCVFIYIVTVKVEKVCEWKLEDAEANLYITKCDQREIGFEGTPKDNDYKFCPYCGRKIVEVGADGKEEKTAAVSKEQHNNL